MTYENGNWGVAEHIYPVYGPTGVWVFKGWWTKAAILRKNTGGGAQVEHKQVFSDFKALLYSVMLCAKNGGLVRRR